MANQLDLGLIEQITPAEQMSVWIARQVLSFYDTLSTRKIAEAHRLKMSMFSGADRNFAKSVRLIDDARDVLMAEACKPEPQYIKPWHRS